MLNTTKSIQLTRSFIDSRGNHYPSGIYKPGEIPEAAWSFEYAKQVEDTTETNSNGKEVLPIQTLDIDQANVITELPDVQYIDEMIEITNPSAVKEIKPVQEESLPSAPKEIKPRTFKHTKSSKLDGSN
jgi:hypothetical protein